MAARPSKYTQLDHEGDTPEEGLTPYETKVILEEEDEEIGILAKKKKEATIFSSVINLANTIMGAGMLGIPFAIAACGLILGCSLIVLSSLAAAFGLHLLGVCAGKVIENAKLTKTRNPHAMESSYYSVARLTYPKAAILIDTAIAVKCFGVSISYLIVIGDLMPEVINSISATFAGNYPIFVDRNFWIAISFVFLAPLSFLKRLDSLRFTSVIALFSVVYLLGIVVGFFFYTEPGQEPKEVHIDLFRMDLQFLKVLPIFVFGFTCHQNLFPIYNELGDGASWKVNRVVGISISICFSVYCVIGILGYLTFGVDVSSNVVKDYHTTSHFMTVARFAIVVLVTFSYPLQTHPCRASLERIIFRGTLRARVSPRTSYLIETFLILFSTYALGFLVKGLDVVFGLVGATGSTTICYILPGAFYVKYHQGEPWTPKRVAALVLAITGVILMTVSVSSIIAGQFVAFS